MELRPLPLIDVPKTIEKLHGFQNLPNIAEEANNPGTDLNKLYTEIENCSCHQHSELEKDEIAKEVMKQMGLKSFAETGLAFKQAMEETNERNRALIKAAVNLDGIGSSVKQVQDIGQNRAAMLARDLFPPRDLFHIKEIDLRLPIRENENTHIVLDFFRRIHGDGPVPHGTNTEIQARGWVCESMPMGIKAGIKRDDVSKLIHISGCPNLRELHNKLARMGEPETILWACAECDPRPWKERDGWEWLLVDFNLDDPWLTTPLKRMLGALCLLSGDNFVYHYPSEVTSKAGLSQEAGRQLQICLRSEGWLESKHCGDKEFVTITPSGKKKIEGYMPAIGCQPVLAANPQASTIINEFPNVKTVSQNYKDTNEVNNGNV